MNAVNLIPSDRRKRSANVSASPATLGLITGLVVALVAAVLYVSAVNEVRARKSELARVTANAASWKAAANSYTTYVTAAQQRTQQIADVRQLASGRFPWSLLLGQIGGVMPADAALSSLQATSPSAGSTAPASTAAGPSTSSTAQSAVALNGCAASQSAVAATMVALHRVHGVASVSLSSTSESAAAASSGSRSAPAAAQNGAGCPFAVSFQMSLQLAQASGAISASSSGTTTATATPAGTAASTPAGTSASTPAGTPASSPANTPTPTSSATPTASVATPSTGAAR
jgi:Tfp pilus assembly protein PilN